MKFIAALFLTLLFTSVSYTQTQPPPPDSQQRQYTKEDLNKDFEQLKSDFEKAKKQMERYKLLMKELDRPVIKKTMTVMADPQVTNSLTGILKNTNWKRLLVAQILALLTIMLLKSWRMEKTRKWTGRLGISFVSFALTIVLMGFVVPRIFIGKSYSEFISNVYKSYKRADDRPPSD